jgi:DNA replication and repair protein RecF
VRGDLGILAHGQTASGGAVGERAPATALSRAAVRRLTLTDFRGYRAARLALEAAPVVLTGPNGAGKTNLLEAVSFLAPGRGLRRAKLGEIDRRQRELDGAMGAPAGDPWALHAAIDTPAGPVEIGTGREPTERETGEASERRVVRIDGAPARSQAALAEHLALVWLIPAMDRLFVEGSSGRRRFLDRLVYGFDPAHARRLSAYEQAMRERARLLRDGPQDIAWLGALEGTMAEAGIAIAAARIEVTVRLDQVCAAACGPFPAARLALAGEIEASLERLPALAAEEAFRTRLGERRPLDRESGTTSLGPHRSDLVVRQAATGMLAAEGSTGEQKALLIAIVLAHGRLQAELRGATPVLLLDEVAAHLDPARRAALFGELRSLGAQTWLTGTDAELFAGLRGAAQFFTVADAALAPA